MTNQHSNELTLTVKFVTGESLKLALGLLPELLERRLQFIESPLSFAEIVTCHLNRDAAPGANETTVTAEISDSGLSLLSTLGAGQRELDLIRKARHVNTSCC